jgi:TRAP-type mannitol/chloroaromatic compound transport system permease small subunit
MAELAPDDIRVETPPHGGVLGLLHTVVTWWGMAGGGVFCLLVAMSIVSIVGRKLFSMPIQGDMELLMMGSAIGSAAFLPLCELHDHHIKVDALTTWMSTRARAALDVLAHGLLLGAAVLLTWRTGLYVVESHESMEVSPLLLIPVWWPVLLIVPSFFLLALSALHRLMVSLNTALGAQP